ncbi:DNA replication protein DnaC [Clostridia bacterium]|nr:DNA replication protein DnaC [Clostridia bacterium]
MSYDRIFKDCMREYEKTRDEMKALHKLRVEKVHKEFPRVREIDLELEAQGLALMKLILSDRANAKRHTEEIKARNIALQEERAKILSENGIDVSFPYLCKVCRDTGFADNKKCGCLKQKLVEKRYNAANLAQILEYENFEQFDYRFYSKEKDPETGESPYSNIQGTRKFCLNFIKNFDTEFTNILFSGDTGLGKTFLCNCIAKELLDKGKVVLYATAPRLFKFFDDYRFQYEEVGEDANDYTEMVNTADLLIIDDLGTEFVTMNSTSELFNIINSRILDRKHTIISTNLTFEDFDEIYSKRITSRLNGNYVQFALIGSDIRPLKKYAKKK